MSRKICEIHVTSISAKVMARYSALAVDRDTMGYFFMHEEIQLEPRKKQYPVVDCQVNLHPAQSHQQRQISPTSFELGCKALGLEFPVHRGESALPFGNWHSGGMHVLTNDVDRE